MMLLFDQEESVRRYGRSQRAEGYAEGFAEGLAEARAEGANLLGSLIVQLLALGRNEDVERAAADPDYRDQLFKEFSIS